MKKETKPKMTRTIEVKLLDKNKKVLPIFNENKFGKLLLKVFGKCPKIRLFGKFKSHKLIKQ